MTRNVLTLGIDVGQSIDPTALVLFETSPDRRHRIHLAQKVPTGTPYPAVVEHIAGVCERYAAVGTLTPVVDFTGVGRPIVDLLRERIGRVVAVTISGGNAVTSNGRLEFVVPKRDLVTGVAVALETHRINLPSSVANGDDLRDELRRFEYTVSDRGHDSYEARTGHDDLVLAAAIGLWYAERPKRKGAVFWGRFVDGTWVPTDRSAS